MLLLLRHLRLLRSVVQMQPGVCAVVKIAHAQTVGVMQTSVHVALVDRVHVLLNVPRHAAIQSAIKQPLHQVAVRKENVRQNNNLTACAR